MNATNLLTRMAHYKRHGKKMHRIGRFKRRDKLFRAHDNIALRLLEQRNRDA
jgi:hypothetical protein